MENLLIPIFIIALLSPFLKRAIQRKREDDFIERQKQAYLDALREYDKEKEGN